MLQCSKGVAEKGSLGMSEKHIWDCNRYNLHWGSLKCVWFFLVVYFCQQVSKLVTVPLLEINIIPALGGETDIYVQLYIHIYL